MTSGQTFAVGVQGFRESTFRITLSYPDGVVPLYNGVPVSGFSDTGKYSYYRFTTNDFTNPITVVLTRLSGDPDLVINNGRRLRTCLWACCDIVVNRCSGCSLYRGLCQAPRCPPSGRRTSVSCPSEMT
jgi:hypothetical protein